MYIYIYVNVKCKYIYTHPLWLNSVLLWGKISFRCHRKTLSLQQTNNGTIHGWRSLSVGPRTRLQGRQKEVASILTTVKHKFPCLNSEHAKESVLICPESFAWLLAKEAVHVPDDVCLNEQTAVAMETMTYTLNNGTPDGGYQRMIFLFIFFLG